MFGDAHQLVLLIYKRTRNFPRDEWYAFRLQMRKAAVSIPTNIVAGNARRTTKEYVNFLFKELNDRCEPVCRQLKGLLETIEQKLLEEQLAKRRRRRQE